MAEAPLLLLALPVAMLLLLLLSICPSDARHPRSAAVAENPEVAAPPALELVVLLEPPAEKVCLVVDLALYECR